MQNNNFRLIARLDIKMDFLIKGVQMEGWRKVGDPVTFAKEYAHKGADELLFMDVVASLYQRNNLHHILEKVAQNIFIPMTVGGGVRSVKDVKELLAKGADKVALNTAATQTPQLIKEISEEFGSQATVVSIEAMQHAPGRWQALTDNGRNNTGRDVIEWAQEAEARGAGEIIATSIAYEGIGKGFDTELAAQLSRSVSIPVVASGGLGAERHLTELINKSGISAAATAQALHWDKVPLEKLRETLLQQGKYVRTL